MIPGEGDLISVLLEELPLSRPTHPGTSCEMALSLSPTHGFPIDDQPHPWNVPRTFAPLADADEIFLESCTASLVNSPHRILAMHKPPGGWCAAGMEALGRIALRALEQHQALVRFHLRATPLELLAPCVLPSLGLLELVRLDVLAGTGTNALMAKMGSSDNEQIIEECCSGISKAGLGRVARLVLVLGLPGESAAAALQTVQFAFRLMLTDGIKAVRFEWWSNPDFGERESVRVSELDRNNIRETILFVRLLHTDLEIIGPDDLPPPY